MKITYQADRKRYQVHYRDSNGLARRPSFKTKPEAEDYVNGRKADIRKGGEAFADINLEDRHMLKLAYHKANEHHVNVLSALDFYIESMGNKEDITMGEAGDLFVDVDLKRRADLRITSKNALKRTTLAFCDQFRDLNVRQIGREEISKFLFGHEWATITIINTRHRLNRLFDWLLAEGYCASNPVKLVRHERLRTDIGRVEAKIPRVLPLEDVVALFTTAQKVMPDFIPYLVLGVFAGVRPTEIVSGNGKPGIGWNMVNMDKSLILIPPRSAKCKVPRKITIHANMQQWLQLGGKLPLTLKEAEGKRKALRMATFGEEWRTRWDSDIMRHTYASYHLEHFKSPDRLKMEMGHQKNSQVLEEHYLNTMIDAEDAEAFWSLTPQSC
tara:strand:- start:11 stop:1165 length:1155 start_codon:yes stop_codon:yes gene_type:complete